VEEDGGDVEEDGLSVDEDEMNVDEDDIDVDEKDKASTKQTRSKHARDDSDYEDEAPALKKTKTPAKKSRR
jgi:hypothetical protein